MTRAPAQPRKLLWPALFAGIGIVILCGLGGWQLLRQGEKRAFIATLLEQAQAPPAALPARADWPALDLDAADLRRVRFTGLWRPELSATVRVAMSSDRGGFGRYMITALELPDGALVLINRGFAPEPEVARLTPPTGRADIEGLMRKPEAGNWFSPAPDLPRRDFHLRDPGTISAALGIAAAPFMVEMEDTAGYEGWPRGVDIADLAARIPNNHLQYAFTWFGLALTLAGVFGVFAWRARREEA